MRQDEERQKDGARRALLAVPAALLAGAAMAQPGQGEAAMIRGTAAYRERIALPPGAVLEVRLEDISRADAPAELLASATIVTDRQVPIPFALAFDPARVNPAHRYTVRATLSLDGQVRWRTDTIHPVLTQGAGLEVALRLVAYTGPAAAAPGGPAASILGREWVAEDILGKGVLDRSRTSITLAPEGRAFGIGGCNRWNGAYTLNGERLSFGPTAVTRMACMAPLDEQEQRFFQALDAVRRWRSQSGLLHLLGEDGSTLIRLAAMG